MPRTTRLGILGIAVSSLLLTSCLTLELNMTFKRSGSIDLNLVYHMDSEFSEFGYRSGADEPWPLPLTERDFRLHALRNEGSELLRYRVQESRDGTRSITVDLRFLTVEALSDFLGADVILSGDRNGGELTIGIPNGEGLDFQEVLYTLADGLDFVIQIQPPGRPESVNLGEIQGRRTSLQIPFTDILSGNAPDHWVIRW